MNNKEKDKEPAALQGTAAAVFPGIFFSYKNGNTYHFQHVHDSDYYCLQAINQKDHRCIPALEPNTIQGNKIYYYKQIISRS